MQDRAAKIQKLANSYETLANEVSRAARKYPEHTEFAESEQKYRAKSQELAEQARIEAERERLEESI